MSTSSIQTPDSAGSATPALSFTGGRFALTPWRTYGLIIGAAVAISAISVALPWTPSYDPWCWLVWGREILHGTLHTQGGASWKPLPVVFTTIFAIFGRAQPVLWLILARAGFVVTVLMAGKLAARFTLWLTPVISEAGPSFRRVRWAAPALAALVAMFTIVLSGDWFTNSALGYSEGLAVAGLILAFERHVDGHYRQAFALGLIPALDRPETWVLWGPYGLWLMWKDPGARALVVGLAILCLVLWFVPQKWGGGSFTSGLTRATHVRSNSNALKSCPFCSEFSAAWTLSIFRVKVAAIAVGVGALGLLGLVFSKRAGWLRLTPLQQRGLIYALVTSFFGFGWWALIALETQAGFSGNSRYLSIGTGFVDLAGGICFGAVAVLLFSLPRMWVPQDRARLKPGAQLSLAVAVLAAIFVAIPNWVGGNYNSPSELHHILNDQAKLRQDLVFLIRKAGGASAMKSCGQGHIMVEGFQVPMVAWYMDDRTLDIEDQPPLLTHAEGVAAGVPSRYDAPVPWPNIILQDRANGASGLLPPTQTIDYWTSKGAHFTVTNTSTMTMYMDCANQANDPQASTEK